MPTATNTSPRDGAAPAPALERRPRSMCAARRSTSPSRGSSGMRDPADDVERRSRPRPAKIRSSAGDPDEDRVDAEVPAEPAAHAGDDAVVAASAEAALLAARGGATAVVLLAAAACSRVGLDPARPPRRLRLCDLGRFLGLRDLGRLLGLRDLGRLLGLRDLGGSLTSVGSSGSSARAVGPSRGHPRRHDAVCGERRDLVVRVPGLAQHLRRVLAEPRRREPVLGALAVERERQRGQPQLRDRRMRNAAGASRAPASAPRSATSATSATGAAGTPAAVSRACQSAVSRSRSRSERSATSSSRFAHAVGVRPEARVVDERRQLERAAERREEPVVPARDHQLAVAGREHLVRRDHREDRALAASARCRPRDSRRGGSRRSASAVSYSDVSTTRALAGPLALEQRGDDAERRPHARCPCRSATSPRARPARPARRSC